MNRFLKAVLPAAGSECHNDLPQKNYYTYSESTILPGGINNVDFQIKFPNPRPKLLTSTHKEDAIIIARLVLYFGHSSTNPEPRFEEEDACFAIDLTLDSFKNENNVLYTFNSESFSKLDCLSYVPPTSVLNSLFKDKVVYVQAVLNLNLTDPDPNTYPGNFITSPILITRDESNKASNSLTYNLSLDTEITHQVPSIPSEHQGWLELLEVKSTVLCDFHNRDIKLYGAVILPKDFDKDTSYPVVFYIEGFTGTEFYLERACDFLSSELGSDWKSGKWSPMIRVVLGSRFTYGHTSFADSAVNGPWASALVTEFIPTLERQYKITNNRFLTGHSSGGWASLWLQIKYPNVFSGTWSSAPDPVDFSKFQLLDIYNSTNAYWEEDGGGNPIPTSRRDGVVTLSMRDENLHERVVGRFNGGQWDCFFAVFGPIADEKKKPFCAKPLFDKVTGEIDPVVAAYWKRFDICHYLRQNPSVLRTTLAGKIHVIVGDEDNYYLDGACRILKSLVEAQELAVISESSSVVSTPNYVDIIPSGDHSSIKSRAFYDRIFTEISTQ